MTFTYINGLLVIFFFNFVNVFSYVIKAIVFPTCINKNGALLYTVNDENYFIVFVSLCASVKVITGTIFKKLKNCPHHLFFNIDSLIWFFQNIIQRKVYVNQSISFSNQGIFVILLSYILYMIHIHRLIERNFYVANH